MSKSAVVLLSGGLDSSTVAYIARKEMGSKGKIYLLSFLYGQRHSFELQCARKIAEELCSPFQVVSVGLKGLVESALVGSSAIPTSGVDPKVIPTTWVPQRNSIFLALAFAYAETVEAEFIYAGMNAVDYSGYPDCRQEFLTHMEKSLNLASKKYVETGRGFGLITPLIEMTKAKIIYTGLELGVLYDKTWSCYKGPDEQGRACGECDSCRIRLAGFATVGAPDPLKYKETK